MEYSETMGKELYPPLWLLIEAFFFLEIIYTVIEKDASGGLMVWTEY